MYIYIYIYIYICSKFVLIFSPSKQFSQFKSATILRMPILYECFYLFFF